MTRRIGLLGGTFDPVHLGHLILASAAFEELRLDQLWFLPAARPPHKPGKPISPGSIRVDMLEAAINSDDRFRIRLDDMANDAPSYTSELLERLVAGEPDAEFIFVIGLDSLRDFHTWHAPERILELTTLAVADRPGVVMTERDLDQVPGLQERTFRFRAPQIEISATDIRERVAAGKSVRYLVPRAVEATILSTGLYRGI